MGLVQGLKQGIKQKIIDFEQLLFLNFEGHALEPIMLELVNFYPMNDPNVLVNSKAQLRCWFSRVFFNISLKLASECTRGQKNLLTVATLGAPDTGLTLMMY